MLPQMMSTCFQQMFNKYVWKYAAWMFSSYWFSFTKWPCEPEAFQLTRAFNGRRNLKHKLNSFEYILNILSVIAIHCANVVFKTSISQCNTSFENLIWFVTAHARWTTLFNCTWLAMLEENSKALHWFKETIPGTPMNTSAISDLIQVLVTITQAQSTLMTWDDFIASNTETTLNIIKLLPLVTPACNY